MKSSRTAITIAYNDRVEVEKGVWENKPVIKKIKAEQETIFQSRKDRLMLDKQVITARFRVRSFYVKKSLDYVEWRGDKYKVMSAYEDVDAHFHIIEIGEML